MTDLEIRVFLGKDYKDVVRINYYNKSKDDVFFLLDDQNVEASIKTNKWKIKTVGGAMFEIDGSDIDSISLSY